MRKRGEQTFKEYWVSGANRMGSESGVALGPSWPPPESTETKQRKTRKGSETKTVQKEGKKHSRLNRPAPSVNGTERLPNPGKKEILPRREGEKEGGVGQVG